MRPVAAPEHPVAELGDQLACERRRVAPRRALARDALGAAHLDKEVLRAHQIEQGAEIGAVEPFGRVDASHVVDHHWHGRALERPCELGDARAVGMDLQVPADLGEARRHRHHRLDRVARAQMLHIVETGAAEALGVKALQFGEGRGSRKQRDAAIVLRPCGDQIGGGGVVEAVRRRLHDYAAFDADACVHREERFLRRFAGRIGAIGGEGKALFRAPDMEVRVGRAARQREARFSRLRLE